MHSLAALHLVYCLALLLLKNNHSINLLAPIPRPFSSQSPPLSSGFQRKLEANWTDGLVQSLKDDECSRRSTRGGQGPFQSANGQGESGPYRMRNSRSSKKWPRVTLKFEPMKTLMSPQPVERQAHPATLTKPVRWCDTPLAAASDRHVQRGDTGRNTQAERISSDGNCRTVLSRCLSHSREPNGIRCTRWNAKEQSIEAQKSLTIQNLKREMPWSDDGTAEGDVPTRVPR